MSSPASSPAFPPSAPPALVLGGGCFWCVEAAYKLLPGVMEVTSGYAGGTDTAPTYEKLCQGHSDHAEVVRITYDPARISLATLLDYFWRVHNPTTLNRQGEDVGPQYRSIILYADEEQRRAAEDSLARANPAWNQAIVTVLAPLTRFHPAEAYHQDYFARNPHAGYCAAVIKPKVDKLRTALAAG
jgi:peptide-methionine (S)-S-oxide reductase